MNIDTKGLMEAIHNLHVRLRKLENQERSLFDAINLTLVSSWTNTGSPYPNAMYWRDTTNTVWFRGRIQGGAVPSTICTLPVGYRPSRTQTWITALNDVIEVASTGIVTVSSGASPVSLDGVAFRAYS